VTEQTQCGQPNICLADGEQCLSISHHHDLVTGRESVVVTTLILYYAFYCWCLMYFCAELFETL